MITGESYTVRNGKLVLALEPAEALSKSRNKLARQLQDADE